MKNPDNWEYITLVECIKGKENILSNILILNVNNI